MGNPSTIIELNGNRYDAITGKLLDTAKTETSKLKPAAKPVGVVDGFMRRPQTSATRTKSTESHLPSTAKRIDHAKAINAQQAHAKVSRSKTLMRHAVKKPGKPAKAQDLPEKSAKAVLHHKVNAATPERIHRAKNIPKSNLISKFGDIKSSFNKKVAHVPVRSSPHHKTELAGAISAIAVSAPINTKEDEQPINPFDMALNNAVGHEQPRLKKKPLHHRAAKKLRVSPKTFSVTAGLIFTLSIGGLFAYKYMPQLAIRLAATRAGVEASLPSYKPSGFSLKGPVQYSSGQITLEYLSNSDDRGFRVIQKSSDWNSQSLLENFIAAGKRSYQTYQDKGKTIYLYENSNATWVSGGVWYQIEGESALSSDQLLRIASSL